MQQHAFELRLPAAETWAPIATEFDLTAASAPCLAVSGAHDLPDFRRIAAMLPELLPTARHLELPWARHLPTLERPAAATDLLVNFLREQ